MSLTLWATKIYWSDSCAVVHRKSPRFEAYPFAHTEIFLLNSYRKTKATETLSSVISSILSKRQILSTKLSFEDFTHEHTMITGKKVFRVANYDRFQFPSCITLNLLHPEDQETFIPSSLKVSC